MHRSERMSKRELAFGSAMLVGVMASKVSCESRKVDHNLELARFKERMESSNTESRQLNYQREAISSLALRDGVLAGGGLLFVVALWFSIKTFRSKINKWRAHLREATRRREQAQQRIARVNEPVAVVPAPIAEVKEVAVAKPPTHPTPKLHPVREANHLKQSLFDTLKPKLNGLAGPVSETLFEYLDTFFVSEIVRDSSLLRDFLEAEPAEFAELFRKKGIKLSDVLDALRKEEVRKVDKVPNGNPTEGGCARNRRFLALESKIEMLRQLALQRGIKPRDLVLQLSDAGFEARTAPGKGGNGHKILFYDGEIVRSADGRPRYVPHANDTSVKDVVLTEVVRTAIAFLEKRKGELAA